MISIREKSSCCGCTSCANICPRHAIKMKPDVLGFVYPSVDENLCVNCELCNKVCQFKKEYRDYSEGFDLIAYAFRLSEESELMKSQSGGAFFAIASRIIRDKGVVYGVGFNNALNVQHKRITNIEQLDEIRFSKYVQSELGSVYSMILADLKAGNIVLFSGTACQVAGLKSFLPSSYYKHLITIDIVCHGVPSPAIWRDYLKYMQEKHHSHVIETCFRDKNFGWNTNQQRFVFSNGDVKYGQTSNYLYFRGYTIRESCYVCPFTNLRRVSDITLGDFWGWHNISDEFNDEKGISLLLVNSSIGANLIDEIAQSNFIQKCRIADCIQPQLLHPTAPNSKHNQFVEDYKKNGFQYIAKKYGDLGFNYQLRIIKSKIKNNALWIKKIVSRKN